MNLTVLSLSIKVFEFVSSFLSPVQSAVNATRAIWNTSRCSVRDQFRYMSLTKPSLETKFNIKRAILNNRHIS